MYHSAFVRFQPHSLYSISACVMVFPSRFCLARTANNIVTTTISRSLITYINSLDRILLFPLSCAPTFTQPRITFDKYVNFSPLHATYRHHITPEASSRHRLRVFVRGECKMLRRYLFSRALHALSRSFAGKLKQKNLFWLPSSHHHQHHRCRRRRRRPITGVREMRQSSIINTRELTFNYFITRSFASVTQQGRDDDAVPEPVLILIVSFTAKIHFFRFACFFSAWKVPFGAIFCHYLAVPSPTYR